MNFNLLAETAAAKYALPVELVKAIIEQESGGNPWATRFEPDFLVRYVSMNPQTFSVASMATERQLRATSFGLMQVMGQVARERGFIGPFLTELCDPAVGIEYGCHVLIKLMARYPNDINDVISAYNAGSANKYPSGMYHNQDYVNSVCERMDRFTPTALTA